MEGMDTMARNKPILVTGSHRSGTTWVGKTLARADGVYYVNEPFNVDFPLDGIKLKVETWFAHFASSHQQSAIKDAVSNTMTWPAWRYAWQVCLDNGLDIKTPGRFAKYFSMRLFKNKMLFKDPLALLSADWFHEQWDADIVVMIRNPFAFAASLKTAAWGFDFSHFSRQTPLMESRFREYKNTIRELAEQPDNFSFMQKSAWLWVLLHEIIRQYQQEYPQWQYCYHEEISLEPVGGFSHLFNALELPLTAETKAYIEKTTSSGNPSEAKGTNFQARDAKASLDTWKKRLTGDEIAIVSAITKPLGEHFYPTMFTENTAAKS
tara:strand:+ start:136 stop:1101 length:966 start_codon:yes stop_codon:yes gene_type:complete